MAGILPDEGQDDQLDRLFAAEAPNLRLGLFTSRTGSGTASVLANINAANYSGYAAQTPAFSAIADSSNGRTRFQAALMTFAHNGGGVSNAISGWYLWNNNTNKLWWVEDFSGPITLSALGQSIPLNPIWYYGLLSPPL